MTSSAEPRRCPLCLRWEHGSGACYPAGSNTSVPAPEQQGEPVCSCPLYIRYVSQFTCPVHGRVVNGEPVGEPVCAQCGEIVTFPTHGPCPMGHSRGQCPEGMFNYHDFEPAPPSSEEAEALPTRSRLWAAFMEVVSGDARDPDEAIDGFSTALKDHEAAIRAPLEERIRERDYTVNLLEAEARQFRTIISRERAENERLREALRNFVNAWDEDMSLDDVGESIDQYLRPALATPPSSTEGTGPMLKTNFDGCPFCGGDDHDGSCEGTKEVEG